MARESRESAIVMRGDQLHMTHKVGFRQGSLLNVHIGT